MLDPTRKCKVKIYTYFLELKKFYTTTNYRLGGENQLLIKYQLNAFIHCYESEEKARSKVQVERDKVDV